MTQHFVERDVTQHVTQHISNVRDDVTTIPPVDGSGSVGVDVDLSMSRCWDLCRDDSTPFTFQLLSFYDSTLFSR